MPQYSGGMGRTTNLSGRPYGHWPHAIAFRTRLLAGLLYPLVDDG